MVLVVFILGMLMGPLAILFELFFKWLFSPVDLAEFSRLLSIRNWSFFINIVFIAPIVEEFLKYGVVRFKILKHSEFDEPLDAMLYMIIAALGFAAIENLLLIFQQPMLEFKDALILITLRFLSATLVHALASGTIGYWLALSLRNPEKRLSLLAKGFAIAIFFHAGYNYLIWLFDNPAFSYLSFILIAALIASMALIVSRSFMNLKRSHAICKICKPESILKQNP